MWRWADEMTHLALLACALLRSRLDVFSLALLRLGVRIVSAPSTSLDLTLRRWYSRTISPEDYPHAAEDIGVPLFPFPQPS